MAHYEICPMCGRRYTPNKVGRPRLYDTDECRELAAAFTVAQNWLTPVGEWATESYRKNLRSFIQSELLNRIPRTRADRLYYLARLPNARGAADVYQVNRDGVAVGDPVGVTDTQADHWMRITAPNMATARKLFTREDGTWITTNGWLDEDW